MALEEIFNIKEADDLSIIYTTLNFQDKNNGFLKLIHYRYRLVKRGETFSPKNKKNLYNFFDLDMRNYLNCIDRCFETKSSLCYHLKILVAKGILIEKPEETYRIPKELIKKVQGDFTLYWFEQIKEKLPVKLLRDIKQKIEKEFPKELEKYLSV